MTLKNRSHAPEMEVRTETPPDGSQAVFYQIYYHEIQIESMWPFATPYYNEGLSIFFENDVISKLVTETKADKIAVCSWKLKNKIKWNLAPPRRPEELTEEILNSDYDVLPLTRNSHHHTMLTAADQNHPSFRSTMTQIVEGIGKNMPFEVKIPIYQNAFSAKREVYQDYVNDYLNPAMELVKNDPEIYKLATVDSNYTVLTKKDCASPEELQQKIGMPYYPLIPFILERLFSVYLENKKINVKFL